MHEENQDAKGFIAVVDDDIEICQVLQSVFTSDGYRVETFNSAVEFLKKWDSSNGQEVSELPDLVVSDIRMPGMDGLELVRKLKVLMPDTPILFVTAHGSLETAIQAIREGALDYLSKPIEVNQLRLTIERALRFNRLSRENRTLRNEVKSTWAKFNIIGKSAAMERVFDLIKRVAPTKANVLITGESGTGKELVARAIHEGSSRTSHPFIAVNCSSIPENLLESELFGYNKGAFTGASFKKTGLFEEADKGTIFLDEIGDMPLHLQSKLLRVLQEMKIKPIGSNRYIDVDVRVVAATHKNLKEQIEKNQFREDLFYRLCVFPIDLPPLRNRKEDIPILANYFLERFAATHAKKTTGFSKDAMRRILTHSWPGNVRELQNTIERAVILTDSDQIEIDALIIESPNLAKDASTQINFPDNLSLRAIGQSYIKHILLRYDGVKEKAAEVLGIDRKTLYRKEKMFNRLN